MKVSVMTTGQFFSSFLENANQLFLNNKVVLLDKGPISNKFFKMIQGRKHDETS
jgi:hypothetical protein